MKAMRLTGIRNMELQTVPTPVVEGVSDVLIQMTRVGVCGSDVHYYTEGKIGSQVVQYPFTVGHEGAGIVKQVGACVTRVKPGDHVAIEPAMPCWQCDQCRVGRPHTCRKLRFLGCPQQAEGCLCEYLVMPETSCFPLPPSVSDDEGALSEPLSIGLYAVKGSIPMQGATVGILGVGPIGLSVMLAALGQGASRIYVTDKINSRLIMAQQAGASWGGNPASGDVVKAILTQEPAHLDVVFECCGQQEALDQAIELLKPGGKLMLLGIPPTLERVSFKIDLLRRHEICIQNVRRQNHCVQPALDMIARHDFNLNLMVTHRYPFSQTQTAFDLVAGYKNGVVKAMIDF
ncbi:MAG: alcohol dehydrogenase catalytic domain-containing protein [bacterium]